MPKYYILMLNFKGRPSPNEAIEGFLNREVLDWLRFASNQYIVQYIGNPEDIYHGVKPLVHPEDDILVLETSLINRYGWVSQIAVDWLKKHVP